MKFNIKLKKGRNVVKIETYLDQSDELSILSAALVLVVYLAHAQVDVARRTVRGNGVGADEAGREQLGDVLEWS